MSRFEDVAGRVAAVATLLAKALRALTAFSALGALGVGLGVAAADRFSVQGLVVGALIALALGVAPLLLFRFAVVVHRVRELPAVSAAELRAAAGQLGSRAQESRRQFLQAAGLGRLLVLVRLFWGLRADLDELGATGVAPAVALAQSLVPRRLIAVSIAALATPALFGTGLVVLALGLALGAG